MSLSHARGPSVVLILSFVLISGAASGQVPHQSSLLVADEARGLTANGASHGDGDNADSDDDDDDQGGAGDSSVLAAARGGGSAPIPAIVTPTSGPSVIGSCQIYPSNNPWNTDISGYPVHPMSATYMTTIAQDFTDLQTGFANPVGSAVKSTQAKVAIECAPGVNYCPNSDMFTNGSPTLMPIPPDAEIENLGVSYSDRHVWVIDTDLCILYELFHANRIKDSDGSVLTTNNVSQIKYKWHWRADSAAIYDLKSNALRPFKKPADTASGLPMFPALVKYEEVASGAVNHALIFSLPRIQLAIIAPATTYASVATDPYNPAYPPMGLRIRLKASYDTSAFFGQAKVLVETMKKYGLFVSDNGASGIHAAGSTGPDSLWNYFPDLNPQLSSIPASAFEVVDTGPLQY